MAGALILEDPATVGDDVFERAGHEARVKIDETYKRATWGRRPEDVAAQQAVIADLQGRR